MASGSLVSSLKLAFSSSSDLRFVVAFRVLVHKMNKRIGCEEEVFLPAIFDSFGEKLEIVSGDIKNLKLGKTSNGVGESFELIRVQIQCPQI